MSLGDGDADGEAVGVAIACGVDGAGLRVASTIAAMTSPTTTTAPPMTRRRCHVHLEGGGPPGATGKPR